MADAAGMNMVGKVANIGSNPTKSSGDDDSKMATMRSRLQMAMAAYSDSREDELDDLRFMAGSPDNQWQWPADVLATRGSVQGQTINSRPCLTINKLPQHVRQVTNDQRQNRPSGKVIPADDAADVQVAEIFNGIVRHIEYMSDADVAYDTACDNQVTYGEGYIRLLTEYCNDETFDQDIRIKRVRNAFSVYMDPTIQDPTGSDAKWCFITEDILKTEYEEMFPDASPVSTLMAQGVGNESMAQWLAEDTIRIAEYFYCAHEPAVLHLYPDNQTAFSGTNRDKQLTASFGPPVRKRNVSRNKVMWMKTNGFDVLEEREWPGKWIPVVRVIGNEFEVEGRIYISGLVRNAKDAQRMYNYWCPLALDTPVPTPSGWAVMGDLVPGDTVFDEHGKPCLVKGLSPVFINRDCYRVAFDDGSTIVADGEHLWAVEARGARKATTWDWSDKTIPTRELVAGTHFIKMAAPLDCPQVELPLDPYFLGVWLGDGDTINPQITQGAVDIEPMRAVLKAKGLDVGAVRKSSTTFRFTVHGVRGRMAEMGLLGRKHIPAEYLRASREQRLELLRGLMDTDGSISANGQCSFTTVLDSLRGGMEELLRSLGLKAIALERAGLMQKFPSGQTYQCADSWQFSFSLPAGTQPFCLPRKQAGVGKRKAHPRRTQRFTISSIERVPSVPVRCIGVDTPTHLFLAGDAMVPTHNSQEAEMLALAPKAPFIAYGGQFEGYENQWKTANVNNWPYLEVNPDVTDGAGNVLPLPQRAQPPLPQTALIQAKMGAADDIKGTTGQYDASLGMQGNERSGKAILAREKQGDVGTYHYVDNLARAIRQLTRQIVDIIPKIYDTQRVARIIGIDNEVSMVKFNPAQPEPVKEVRDQDGAMVEKIYNPTVGTYDVMVTTGPGYMTKRQEALDAMSQILQTNPQLWSVAGDLFIKNMDWPGAQEIAARFKKILDPKVLSEGDQSPEMMQAHQQIEAMTQELNRMSDIMSHVQDSVAQREVDIKEYKAQVDAYDAETKRISAMQNSMSPEQVQDIVMGTIHAAIETGDLSGGMPRMPEAKEPREMPYAGEGQEPQGGMAPEAPQMAPEAPQMAPEAPEGMMA